MIVADELKTAFKLLSIYSDEIIDAYLSTGGIIELDDYRDEEVLSKSRLIMRRSDDGPQLTRPLTQLLDIITQDPRRVLRSPDVGAFIESLRVMVGNYQNARRSGKERDVAHYYKEISDLVFDMEYLLLGSSSKLWSKINNNFAYVSTLELKIHENASVLAEAKRLSDELEGLHFSDLSELAGSIPDLVQLFLREFHSNIVRCRTETKDAIHKLDELLFVLRQRESTNKLVTGFYRAFQNDPGFEVKPPDWKRVSSRFNLVYPLDIRCAPDISSNVQEQQLQTIIAKIKTVTYEPGIEEEDSDVAPALEPIEFEIDTISIAVDEFYCRVLEEGVKLSAVDHCPDELIEEAHLWVHSVLSHYYALKADSIHFKMERIEEVSPEFSGLHFTRDLMLSPRTGARYG